MIIVGGELRLEQLEITNNPTTGILESPIQLKSNCGALVVDDFGRQRCSTSELLNRWIIPLEKGHDYLNLPSGRQIQAPFDQLLVFSTNLPPHKLVDEAFLRRIPYKIEVSDPSPREFRDLLKQWCGKLAIEYREDAVEYLLTKHFTDTEPPPALLPAPRPRAPGQSFLRIPGSAARAEQHGAGRRREELFCWVVKSTSAIELLARVGIRDLVIANLVSQILRSQRPPDRGGNIVADESRCPIG